MNAPTETPVTEKGCSDRLSLALLALIGILLVVLFHFVGNTADVATFGTSVFTWMIRRWEDATFSVGGYSLGWLIPLVSAFAVWRMRRELAIAPKDVLWSSLFIVIAGLVLHWVGARAQQPRVSLGAFLVLLWGIPRLLYGPQVSRLLTFPVFYLVFCIPMNFIDSFSFALRILATTVSTAVLNGIGIAVERSGSAIYSESGRFSLEVADPCSGIRSLLALVALATAYAYFTQKVRWKRLVLFASAIPLAVVGNIVRVISIGIVAHFGGQERAVGFYHTWSGYLVFVVAILLMTRLGDLLEKTDKVRNSDKALHTPT